MAWYYCGIYYLLKLEAWLGGEDLGILVQYG